MNDENKMPGTWEDEWDEENTNEQGIADRQPEDVAPLFEAVAKKIKENAPEIAKYIVRGVVNIETVTDLPLLIGAKMMETARDVLPVNHRPVVDGIIQDLAKKIDGMNLLRQKGKADAFDLIDRIKEEGLGALVPNFNALLRFPVHAAPLFPMPPGNNIFPAWQANQNMDRMLSNAVMLGPQMGRMGGWGVAGGWGHNPAPIWGLNAQFLHGGLNQGGDEYHLRDEKKNKGLKGELGQDIKEAYELESIYDNFDEQIKLVKPLSEVLPRWAPDCDVEFWKKFENDIAIQAKAQETAALERDDFEEVAKQFYAKQMGMTYEEINRNTNFVEQAKINYTKFCKDNAKDYANSPKALACILVRLKARPIFENQETTQKIELLINSFIKGMEKDADLRDQIISTSVVGLRGCGSLVESALKACEETFNEHVKKSKSKNTFQPIMEQLDDKERKFHSNTISLLESLPLSNLPLSNVHFQNIFEEELGKQYKLITIPRAREDKAYDQTLKPAIDLAIEVIEALKANDKKKAIDILSPYISEEIKKPFVAALQTENESNLENTRFVLYLKKRHPSAFTKALDKAREDVEKINDELPDPPLKNSYKDNQGNFDEKAYKAAEATYLEADKQWQAKMDKAGDAYRDYEVNVLINLYNQYKAAMPGIEAKVRNSLDLNSKLYKLVEPKGRDTKDMEMFRGLMRMEIQHAKKNGATEIDVEGLTLSNEVAKVVFVEAQLQNLPVKGLTVLRTHSSEFNKAVDEAIVEEFEDMHTGQIHDIFSVPEAENGKPLQGIVCKQSDKGDILIKKAVTKRTPQFETVLSQNIPKGISLEIGKPLPKNFVPGNNIQELSKSNSVSKNTGRRSSF